MTGIHRQPVLIPGLLEKGCIERDVNAKMDLGSVNAPPPLEHRQSGVGWSTERNYEQKN